MGTVKITLSKKEWKEIANEMEDWSGFELTIPQMEKILKTDISVFATIAQYKGLDTSLREEFMDLIGKFLGMKEYWPIGATSESKTKKYFKELAVRAKKSGLKFNEEAFKA